MPTGSTIAAPCTASGQSARAMIRVSGTQARSCLESIADISLDQRGVYRVRLKLEKAELPALVLWYPTPQSYTGEDTAEIVMAGNQVLVRRVMDVLLAFDGVEYAQPGEFSARAYLNHRLTLQQAEGIALRIAAEHEDTLQAAQSLLDGSYGDACLRWVNELANLLALVEAGVDFSDQDDVVPITPADLYERLNVLIDQIQSQLGSQQGDRVHSGLPSVVFVGKPNAGKSSLFNALLGTTRSVVSERAGTTRDVLKETLRLSADIPGAGDIDLVDVAGLDHVAIDEIDRQGQEQARRVIEQCAVAIWCDPSGRFDQQDLTLFGIHDSCQLIRVRTKSDLPIADSEFESPSDCVQVCAFDLLTLNVLRRGIADAACKHDGDGVGVFVPRHRRALREAHTQLLSAVDAVVPVDPSIDAPELVALGMRHALDALGELVGEISPDDVIGRVFSTFCVGK